jgi:uncharacterized protein YbjT (DUF2867 family)
MEQYKNVLILGATSYPAPLRGSFALGAEIAKSFLASSRPWKISILARNSTKEDPKKKELLDYYTSKGATIVFGDVEKPETLSNVFKGIDLVVSVMSGSGMYSGASPELNAIKAAYSSGVKWFVPSGWTYDAWDLPADDIRTFKSYLVKKAALDLIKSLGMAYTLFDTIWFEFLLNQPTGFDFEKKIWELPGDGKIRYSAISLEDIATLVEEVLAHPELSKNTKVQLATDEFSANEMVDLFEQVSGLKITRKYVPLAEIRHNQEDTSLDTLSSIIWNFRRVYAEDESKVYFPHPFNKAHKELASVKTKGYRHWIKEYVKNNQN